MHSSLRASTALALTLASAALAAPARSQETTTSGPEAVQLSEIVVTAQRRAENIQDVPVAVTALGEQTLSDLRVTDVNDLSGLAPNLVVLNQGIASIPNIAIRGITSGVSNNAVDPKIAIYLDGVYIGRSVGAIFDIADLERVEVLRGPQGTLFGRNATGGAISLVTAPPTGEFGVKAYASYGNFDAFRTRVTVNLPAFGRLSAKISYLHDEARGEIRNLIGGRAIDFRFREPSFGTLTYADRLGDRNVDAVQVAVRLAATERLTFDYRFDYSDSRTVGSAIQVLGPVAGGIGPLAAGLLAFQPLFGGITNVSLTRLDEVANATSLQPLKVEGHSLTATIEANDDVTVKSITAYRKFRQLPNIYDLAGTGGLRFTAGQLGALLTGNVAGVFNPAVAPGPNDSFFTLLTARETSQKQFSQELQVIVTKQNFDLTAGAFYFHENSPAIDVLGIFQPVANGIVIPTPFDAIFGSGVTDTTAINDSMALYAQGTYHLTPQLDATFGVRYTADNRETILRRTGAPGVGGGGILPPGTYKKDYSRLNYTGILTFRPSDAITAYAKVATGYVAGGILGAIPYDPETVTSYEVGLKSELLDRRLRVNLAGFYTDYQDLQVQTFINGVQRFENAGKARIYGFEAEVDAAPVQGLSLGGSLGYQNFRYKEYIQEGVDITDIVRPIYSPKWSVRLYGQYDVPAFSNGWNLYGRVDARWRSRAEVTALPTGNPTVDDAAITPAHWIVDARAGIANIDIGGAKATLSAWAQNLLDKDDVFLFGPTAINQVATFVPGRTYGVDLSFNF